MRDRTSRLIDALSNSALYADAASVELRQTHISLVFLAGDFVYKIKKPVQLPFLDFSTLEKRRYYCQQEVALNRRLAADVYLSVLPIIEAPQGLILGAENSENQNRIFEWCVKMRRLPDAATLFARLQRGEVGTELVELLAERIATFHRNAETNERISSMARWGPVAQTVMDVFEEAKTQAGQTVSPSVFARVQALAQQMLERLHPLIDARADRGVPRDAHGDLHLDHIYYFPEREPPTNLVIIDCIEFNERFRYIDPVADMAFACMDFAFHGRRDLARVFAEAYFRAAEGDEGRALLPLYGAYRAMVRGMVDGLLLTETEVPETQRRSAQRSAQAHWLLALTELEEPARKPCVVLVAGLPGSGKSTLARQLAATAGFEVIRSDVVRKQLAGVTITESLPRPFYSAEWNERTYTECLSRAERLVLDGKRVVVDATFREEAKRRAFLDAAAALGVPGLLLICRAQPETIRQRMSARAKEASDADWSVYEQIAAQWEELGPLTQIVARVLSSEGDAEGAALAVQQGFGLR